MSAEVVDLAVVRGAYARAIPVEQYVAPMTLAEIEVEVEAIRAELVSPMQRLARLREAGAHLTAFGPSVTWHEAVERWLGDLRVLRLSGSPEAVEERNALVYSLREQGASTRAIRDRLGVSSYAVQQALDVHDPAPERIVGADGASRSSRGQRREQLPAPTGRVYEQCAEYLRRADDGLTLAELARVAGWSEGKASGALSDCLRRKGTAVRSEVLRGGMRVHYAVEAPA
jgi:transposase